MVKFMILRSGIGDTPTSPRMLITHGLETNPNAGASSSGIEGEGLVRKKSGLVLSLIGVKTRGA